MMNFGTFIGDMLTAYPIFSSAFIFVFGCVIVIFIREEVPFHYEEEQPKERKPRPKKPEKQVYKFSRPDDVNYTEWRKKVE